MDRTKDAKPLLPTPTPPAAEKAARRFRLEKLEERIAPKKGGRSTNNCATGLCESSDTGTSGY
jgi:hypothetical protein